MAELDDIHYEYAKQPTFELLKTIQARQINLVEKILNTLIHEKENDDYLWEKACLIPAMALIESNIARNKPGICNPTFIWQTLPLVSIEKALIPETEKSKELGNLIKYKDISIEEVLSFCKDVKFKLVRLDIAI